LSVAKIATELLRKIAKSVASYSSKYIEIEMNE